MASLLRCRMNCALKGLLDQAWLLPGTDDTRFSARKMAQIQPLRGHHPWGPGEVERNGGNLIKHSYLPLWRRGTI